jgi:hypothetical protein
MLIVVYAITFFHDRACILLGMPFCLYDGELEVTLRRAHK